MPTIEALKKIEKYDKIVIEAKTNKAQTRLERFGNIFQVERIEDEVEFSNIKGSWLLVHVNWEDESYRWINGVNSYHYKVTDIYKPFGNFARGTFNMQCQYFSRYLHGKIEGFPKLLESVRILGEPTKNYHDVYIHADDCEPFEKAYREYVTHFD